MHIASDRNLIDTRFAVRRDCRMGDPFSDFDGPKHKRFSCFGAFRMHALQPSLPDFARVAGELKPNADAGTGGRRP